MDRILWS